MRVQLSNLTRNVERLCHTVVTYPFHKYGAVLDTRCCSCSHNGSRSLTADQVLPPYLDHHHPPSPSTFALRAFTVCTTPLVPTLRCLSASWKRQSPVQALLFRCLSPSCCQPCLRQHNGEGHSHTLDQFGDHAAVRNRGISGFIELFIAYILYGGYHSSMKYRLEHDLLIDIDLHIDLRPDLLC